MNPMNMPGFTAATLLSAQSSRYRTVASASNTAHSLVKPQLRSGNGPIETTIDELKNRGYHCEPVSVGNIDCSKPGSPTYTCSGGICIVSPWKRIGGTQGFETGTLTTGTFGHR